MSTEQREVRSFRVDGIQVRAAEPGKPRVLIGYAAKFNVETVIGGYFREKILPGAFANVIKTADVRCLAQHEDCLVLGRSKAGTLRLYEDQIGLRYECDLPDTSAGRDTAVSVERGDITGSSFSFVPSKVQWTYATQPGELDLRDIAEIGQLYDVGPVTFPAYEDTEAAVRSHRAHREDFEGARRDLELRLRLATAAA